MTTLPTSTAPPVPPPPCAGAGMTVQTITDEKTRKVFRKSAQAFIINEHGNVFAGTPMQKCNAAFRQTVQGGIEGDETEEEGLAREIQEEIGLTVGVQLRFVEHIVPDRSEGPFEDAPLGHPFRYLSKTWRKLGIAGQQLYPSLYFAHSDVLRQCRLKPQDQKLRREFFKVSWAPLSELLFKAPPSKRSVMEAIVPCVYEAAHRFLTEHYPRIVRGFETDNQGLMDSVTQRQKLTKLPREHGHNVSGTPRGDASLGDTTVRADQNAHAECASLDSAPLEKLLREVRL